jgi:FKBP-type peptidyl-prolyl cis-trans isomerase SlyD
LNIAKDAVVTLDIELWDLWGKQLEASDAPMQYLHGGYEGIFPAVEAALEGKGVGEKIEVRLEPEDAFGEYDDELVRVESRELFPEGITAGMQFEGIPGDDESGDDDELRIYTVTDVAEDAVVLDGNHPFAGIALKFICTIRSVRNATPDELERGGIDDPSDGVVRVVH